MTPRGGAGCGSTESPGLGGIEQVGRGLVTGAGGSIDSAICRQVAAQELALLLLLDRGETALFEIDKAVGERLHGELWNGTEEVAPTAQDKLLVIRRPEAEGASLSRFLGDAGPRGRRGR